MSGQLPPLDTITLTPALFLGPLVHETETVVHLWWRLPTCWVEVAKYLADGPDHAHAAALIMADTARAMLRPYYPDAPSLFSVWNADRPDGPTGRWSGDADTPLGGLLAAFHGQAWRTVEAFRLAAIPDDIAPTPVPTRRRR